MNFLKLFKPHIHGGLFIVLPESDKLNQVVNNEEFAPVSFPMTRFLEQTLAVPRICTVHDFFDHIVLLPGNT